MRIVGSLLLGFALVTAAYAQQAADQLSAIRNFQNVQDTDIVEPELKPLAIDERPDETRMAAIRAVKAGNNLWRLGKLEQSAAKYQQAAELQPSLYAAQLNLAEVKLQLRQFSDAVATFEKAIAVKPESALAWEGLGLTHFYQAQYRLAADAFERARQLAPGSARFNSNLGFTYLFLDRWEAAIASFKTTLDLDQDFHAAQMGLCAGYALARQTEAVAVCLNVVKNDPAAAGSRYFLGHAYLNAGDTQDSIKFFEEAARLEPATAKIYVGLGFACYRAKQYGRALSYFQRARELDENTPDVFSGIGVAYADMRKFDKAELALREAISRDPEHGVNHFNLGIVCLQRKNRDCALGEYNFLKMTSDPLAKTLFSTMNGDKLIDATAYESRPSRWSSSDHQTEEKSQ